MSGDLLTVVEVAKILRVSAAWVRQHANGTRRPALPRVKAGGIVRFRREDIEAFIRKHSETDDCAA